jgi:hypothetical protein
MIGNCKVRMYSTVVNFIIKFQLNTLELILFALHSKYILKQFMFLLYQFIQTPEAGKRSM